MKSEWFTHFNCKTTANIRLFCFPYAGGTASIFSKWHESLAPYAQVFALQAPGKANRLSEIPISEMNEFTSMVVANMMPLIDKDYMLFGHSLGAKVAFEIALKLVGKGMPAPKHFIASASSAPSAKRNMAPFFDLPDELFIEKLRELGGTSDVVLQTEELRTIYFPAMRADFQMLDNYQGNNGTLASPALIFYGIEDHTVAVQDVRRWKQHFTQKSVICPVLGGHFFINSNTDKVLKLIRQMVNL